MSFISSRFITEKTAFHRCTFSFIPAHFVYHCALKHALATDLLRDNLHRLRVPQPITYKLCLIRPTYKALNDWMPGCTSNFCIRIVHKSQPAKTLLNRCNLLQVPRFSARLGDTHVCKRNRICNFGLWLGPKTLLHVFFNLIIFEHLPLGNFWLLLFIKIFNLVFFHSSLLHMPGSLLINTIR